MQTHNSHLARSRSRSKSCGQKTAGTFHCHNISFEPG
jgi:hypothetical protein